MEKVIPEPEGLDRISREIVSCRRCSRLVGWREKVALEKRAMFRDQEYWGRPVPGFGDPEAALWIIGLAPAAHGGNRTGRVFTGDRSGDFLFRCLYETGWARYPSSWGINDGQKLDGVWISAAVRCAPPENRPSPEEFGNCRPFLGREYHLLKHVRAVLVFGKLALGEWFSFMREEAPAVFRKMPSFAHGMKVAYPAPHPRLFVSYHPSQRNTQTGLLTEAMLCNLLESIRSSV